MPAKFCIQNAYKSLRKCGILFVYILCIKMCRDVGYILYTNILYTFRIHQFWSTKSVHHKRYVYNLYTKFIQNTKLKGLWAAKIYIQNLYKILINITVQKLHIIRTSIKFVYKTCTKCKKVLGGTERDRLCTLNAPKIDFSCATVTHFNPVFGLEKLRITLNDFWYVRWHIFSFAPLTIFK